MPTPLPQINNPLADSLLTTKSQTSFAKSGKSQLSSLSVPKSFKLMKDPAGGYKPHKGSSLKASFEIQKIHKTK